VSEQTGIISVAKSGMLRSKIDSEELTKILEEEL